MIFKNPKGELLSALRVSGPVAGDTGGDLVNGKKGGRASGIGGDGDGLKKKKKGDVRGVDMDALAEKLQKLGEDDLLQVVQMVHDQKSEDSWMRNDVDREFSRWSIVLDEDANVKFGFLEGEFHVDLYTLPEPLIKTLWDFTNEKVGG